MILYKMNNKDLLEVADALTDILYVTYKYLEKRQSLLIIVLNT